MRKRQGIEKDAIHDGEDGGVGADAKSEGEYSDGSEAGGFAHHAQGIVDVLKNASEQIAAALSQRYGLAIQIILDCQEAARERSSPFSSSIAARKAASSDWPVTRSSW
jgi:hypothetical protein